MNKTRILVVEDESIIAEDIMSQLQDLGYEVTAVASSGRESLDQIKKNPPDLVLIDIKLKGSMSGVEASDLIHNQFDIPVIFVTAFADKDTMERAKRTEPFGIIFKPFIKKELYGVIETALYKYKIGKKLKEKEAWLSTTLSSIGDAVITTDTKGKITFMNPEAEKLTGWKQEEASEKQLKQVFQIINEETDKPVQSPVDTVLKEGNIVRLANSTALLSKNGTSIPIDDSGAPIKDAKGNITGVVLTFKDITERKQAENALQVSEEKFSKAFHASPDAILLTKLESGEIIEINEGFERISGYSREEVIGSTTTALNLWQNPKERAEIAAKIANGEKIQDEEINFKNKSGKDWIGLLTIEIIDIENEKHAISIVRDITEIDLFRS